MLMLGVWAVASWHVSSSACVTTARVSRLALSTRVGADLKCCALDDDVQIERLGAEIASLRAQVADLQRERDDLLSSASPMRPATELTAPMERKGPRSRRRPSGRAGSDSRIDWKRPKPIVYRLYGELPAGYDATPVERLLAKRVVARMKKRYSEADRLQRRVMRMGVRIDDRRRTWSLQPNWQEAQAKLKADDDRVPAEQQRLQREVDQRIRRFFDFMDADNNGKIDRGEFRLAMQVLAIPGGRLEYDATFDRWDHDGNGGLDFDEIRQALTELEARHPEAVSSAHDTVAILDKN